MKNARVTAPTPMPSGVWLRVCGRCGGQFEHRAGDVRCFDCRVKLWDSIYARPEKLDRDECWVSVAAVHESSGVREHETRWATLSIGPCDMETIAKDAALDWHRETDQATDCDVSIKVERYDGVTHVYRIQLAHELVAHLVVGIVSQNAGEVAA